MTNTKPNSSWLKTLSIGFSIISFGITLAIVGYIVLTTKQNQPANQPSPSSTVDETASWKTYADKQHGYSLSYPSSFILQQTEWGIILTKRDVTFVVGVDGGITITYAYTEVKNVTVDRVPAKKYFYKLSENGSIFEVNTQAEFRGKNYQIDYSKEFKNSLTEEDVRILEEILSTFQFTD